LPKRVAKRGAPGPAFAPPFVLCFPPPPYTWLMTSVEDPILREHVSCSPCPLRARVSVARRGGLHGRICWQANELSYVEGLPRSGEVRGRGGPGRFRGVLGQWAVPILGRVVPLSACRRRPAPRVSRKFRQLYHWHALRCRRGPCFDDFASPYLSPGASCALPPRRKPVARWR
jgi:hypothetical protein